MSPNPMEAFLDLSAMLQNQMFTLSFLPSSALYSLKASLLPQQRLLLISFTSFFSFGWAQGISLELASLPQDRIYLYMFQNHLYTDELQFYIQPRPLLGAPELVISPN